MVCTVSRQRQVCCAAHSEIPTTGTSTATGMCNGGSGSSASCLCCLMLLVLLLVVLRYAELIYKIYMCVCVYH